MSSEPTQRISQAVGYEKKEHSQAEKRKADNKSGGATGGDGSTDLSSSVLIPSKKSRVDFTPSKSPVMSPIFEDSESPTKLLYPPPKDKIETNIDLASVPLLEEDDENQNGESESLTNKSKFKEQGGNSLVMENEELVLSSPRNTTVEMESVQDKGHGTTVGANEDFFAEIKAKQVVGSKLNDESEAAVSAVVPEQGVHAATASTSTIGPKVVTTKFVKKSTDKALNATDSKYTTCTSIASSVDSDYLSSSNSSIVEVEMKAYCGRTRALLYDTRGFRLKIDHETFVSILTKNGIDVSQISSSGYSGDISASSASTGMSMSSVDSTRQKFVSMGSTISTIPRASEASTLSRPSLASNVDVDESNSKKLMEPPARSSPRSAKASKVEQILTSTRIDEKRSPHKKINDMTTEGANLLDINSNTSSPRKPIMSNGETSDESSFESASSSFSNSLMTPTAVEAPKSGKFTPKLSKREAAKTAQSNTESSDVSKSTSKVQTPKGRLDGSTSNSTSEDQSESQESSSSSSSRKRVDTSSNKKNRKREGHDEDDEGDLKYYSDAARKAINEFNDKTFVKSATLWGTITPHELVFARWRDRTYYSGVITDKGSNDTWQIKFDDNMDDVASETHILPIKILGVGTCGTYCPEGVYKPEDVCVVGSRNGSDKSIENMEYAVVSKNTGKIIICVRKQLTLKEHVAKELRKLFQAPALVKAADVNFDNIVSGTRRRGAAETLTPSDKIRRIIQLEQSGFDTSTTDEQLLRESILTPTPKKPAGKSGVSTSASRTTNTDSIKRRGSNISGGNSEESSDATHPVQSTPGSATSFKGASLKETPKGGKKEAAKKTKEKLVQEKGLFEGLQFFMTASGGVGPSGSGVVPYDKDDYRDLIEKAGGRIIDVVGNESAKLPTYLISDNYARTVKYIYCLASGIPCVSHMWIEACLQQNTVIEWRRFQLESGWSLEEEKVIATHNRKPLKDVKIYVTAESADLYNYWKPVLTAAQANLLKPKKKGPLVPTEAEVLVTDPTCPSNVINKAIEKGIPIVKPEWLVQTIILGKKTAYDGHEKYQIEVNDRNSSSQEDGE